MPVPADNLLLPAYALCVASANFEEESLSVLPAPANWPNLELNCDDPSLILDNPDFKSDAPLDADFIPPLTDLSPSSCLDATVFNPELIWFKLDAALFNWLDCSFKLPPNCFICAASSVSPSAAAFWAKAVIWASSSLESEDDNLEETWETESANESTLLVELIKLSTPSPNWFNPLFKLLAPLYAEDIPLSILSYALSKLFALLT